MWEVSYSKNTTIFHKFYCKQKARYTEICNFKPQSHMNDIYMYTYIYKNNLKIMNLKRGVGIDHWYKK